MKKHKLSMIFVILVSCLLVCAIVAIIAVNIYRRYDSYRRIPECYAEITGNIIDNDYNNFLSGGNLVRIDNKLYYNYYRNDSTCGLMEITESGSKCIYRDDTFDAYRRLHFIRQHDGQLVMANYDKIQAYSPETDTFEIYKPLNSISKMTLYYQIFGQKLIYRQETEPQDKEFVGVEKVALYDEKEASIVINSDVDYFYVSESEVYYFAYENNDKGEFRKCNITDGTDISVCQLDGYFNIFPHIIEDNYLIFSAVKEEPDGAQRAVYKINLNSSEKSIEMVCTADTEGIIFTYNAYDGKLYVATKNGLTAYDVRTNESSKLFDGEVQECYIVDDTWVYFENVKSQLMRVPQTGGTTELVFG